jgi:RNA polymerase sigma-70 factor (ECF subfamily)
MQNFILVLCSFDSAKGFARGKATKKVFFCHIFCCGEVSHLDPGSAAGHIQNAVFINVTIVRRQNVPLPSHKPLEDLLEAYRDGSLDAFDEFFRRTRDPLYSYVKRRVKNSEAAQDIIQDAFLRIHRYIGSFKRSEGKALPWLLSVVQNCINDYYSLQKAKPGERGFELEPEASYEQGMDERLFLKEIILALEKRIDPEELDLLLQRLVVGFSFNEIAYRKGILPDNARQKFSRILKKIRHLTADY